MLYYALVFLVIALIAGVLGVSGVAGVATNIAYVLFVIAIVLFLGAPAFRTPDARALSARPRASDASATWFQIPMRATEDHTRAGLRSLNRSASARYWQRRVS